jgi:integrase
MLTQVADGVWVRQSEWVWTNSIAVRGEDGLILIDPGIDGSELHQLADDVDGLGIPVVAGFSTHPHWDHLLWHPRFGDVPRYATPAGAQAAGKARERAQKMAAQSASGIPLERDERPRPQRRRQRVLGRAEIERLLAVCPPRDRLMIATVLYTGLRISEMLGLIWEDIDFAAGVIHVRAQLSRAHRGMPARRVPPKTASSVRDVPLVPQLARLLAAHKQASRFIASGDWVFATARGTPHGHRNVARRSLGRAVALARLNADGWPPLRFHDLRHTFASHLIIDLGLDVAQVSRILGHARVTITLDIYTHLFDDARHARDIRSRMADSGFAELLDPPTDGDAVVVALPARAGSPPNDRAPAA